MNDELQQRIDAWANNPTHVIVMDGDRLHCPRCNHVNIRWWEMVPASYEVEQTDDGWHIEWEEADPCWEASTDGHLACGFCVLEPLEMPEGVELSQD